MFKDCKNGGYNLEDSKASVERLTNLVLLMAIAYTCAGLQGQVIKSKGQQRYIGRLKELKRLQRRHSNFWIGFAVSSAERFVRANVDCCPRILSRLD